MWSTNTALRHGGKGPFWTDGHSTQIIVIADTGKDDVLALRRLARRFGKVSAMGFDPGLCLGRGSIVNGHIMPFGGKMSRHRKAHDA